MIDIGIATVEVWHAILAFFVGVIGAARLTRVVVYDDFPPAMRFRIWWDTVTKDGPWAKLVHCGWCFGFWATVAMVASFLVSFAHPALGWAWWLFWGVLAMSYLVSQYVHFDEGRGE